MCRVGGVLVQLHLPPHVGGKVLSVFAVDRVQLSRDPVGADSRAHKKLRAKHGVPCVPERVRASNTTCYTGLPNKRHPTLRIQQQQREQQQHQQQQTVALGFVACFPTNRFQSITKIYKFMKLCITQTCCQAFFRASSHLGIYAEVLFLNILMHIYLVFFENLKLYEIYQFYF